MSKQRQDLQHIFDKAIDAVSPEYAVRAHLEVRGSTLYCEGKDYDLSGVDNIYVLGAGKGAAPMVVALENLLGSQITEGLVCVKYDHSVATSWVDIAEASHPVPDHNGVKTTTKMLALAEKAGERDLVICVITGGASSLTPSFAGNIRLEDTQELTSSLLASGASIDEINCVRKHISTFSGGHLAVTAYPAQVLSLIISDVIGDDLSSIASGPTTSDPTTYHDASAILTRYGIDAPASIKEHLKKGIQGKSPETPKKENLCFARTQNVLVATNAQALEAAHHEAEGLGYRVHHAPTMEGEAREVAQTLIAHARTLQGEDAVCIIAGGETTVTLQGSGLGGRNQEMALAASLEMTAAENIHCLFAGTDGSDGPTDATGGFACPATIKSMDALAIDGADYLANNDAYHFLEKTESLLKTGPTRTNVMDIAIILVPQKA